MVLGDKFLRCCNSLFHCQSVEREAVETLLPFRRRVGDNTLLGVETGLADVSTLDKRYDRQIEMARKSIVAAVVSRYGHDGSGAISCQDILRNPYWNAVAGERIDGIRAREYTRDVVVGHALKLGAALDISQIFVDLGLLISCRQLGNELTLRG